MPPSISSQKSPLVSAEWLHQKTLSKDQGLLILDCSYHLGEPVENARQRYENSHIEHAHFFNIDEYADPSSSLPHMLPNHDGFLNIINHFQIGKETVIICYDNSPLHSAARVWWMFRAYGIDRVRVLDGGLNGWLKAGYETSACLPTLPSGLKNQPSTDHLFKPALIPSMVTNLNTVTRHSLENTAQVIDARAEGRFLGTAPEPRPNLPSGHMPNAFNIPYQQLFDDQGYYKKADELSALFNRCNIDLTLPVIASCGSGITACTIAVALCLLGKWDTSIYDGSWIEWASHYGDKTNPQTADQNMIRTSK